MAFHHPMILQIFLAYLVCCFNPLLAQQTDTDEGMYHMMIKRYSICLGVSKLDVQKFDFGQCRLGVNEMTVVDFFRKAGEIHKIFTTH